MKPALFFIFLATLTHAAVRLPSVISEHMVLQSGRTLPIWGWADAGEKVVVTIAGQTQSAVADASGKWRVTLDALPPSDQPQTLNVSGIEIHDVLVGEVWLASGQSNMEMKIKDKMHGSIDNADEVISAAKHPEIRVFEPDVPYAIYEVPAPPELPLPDRAGAWHVCSPETVEHFTACGYLFASELNASLHKPVGILCAAVGGTPIEAWTSLEKQHSAAELTPLLTGWQKRLSAFDAQRDYDAFQSAKKAWLKIRSTALKAKQPAPKAPAPFKNIAVMRPGGLFNGVIAPLVPYAVRGVIWYQGERNAAGPFTGLYGPQLELLIADWRARFGEDVFFAWVQLPGFSKPQKAPSEPTGWGVSVREGMRTALRVQKTGMAITMDLGGEKAGHPTNKTEFAHRLALVALHDVYGQQVGEWTGPLFRSARMEGSAVILSFDHAAGMKASSGNEVRGFAVSGKDGKFGWATATIVGETIRIENSGVREPTEVRYGWAGNPVGNLVNGAGLPASPFQASEIR